MQSCDAPISRFERDEHENQDKSPNRDCDVAHHAGQIEITIQAIANLDRRTVKSTGREEATRRRKTNGVLDIINKRRKQRAGLVAFS